MRYIDEATITNKRILLRVDYNVSLNPDHSIANDERIRQSMPTIKLLLQNHNRLILVAHLGRPKGRDEKLSLKPLLPDIKQYLPDREIVLIDDFTKQPDMFTNQSIKQVLLLENIRFYEGEENNDTAFAKQLAALADVYVNDAFSVSHRESASVVGVTKFLPSFGGLLMKKEVTTLSHLTKHPQKPFVAILGGSKISTKIKLIDKLTQLADYVILGGGLANTFLAAQGVDVGKSVYEKEQLHEANRLIGLAKKHNTALLLPTDVITAQKTTDAIGTEKSVTTLTDSEMILDIGPDTQARIEAVILSAKTIAWNGPVGYFENPSFKRGTDFLYYAITQNNHCLSVIGGGETLAAVSKKEYLDKISHISTGGGAMLEFIENGTLPGIAALDKNTSS